MKKNNSKLIKEFTVKRSNTAVGKFNYLPLTFANGREKKELKWKIFRMLRRDLEKSRSLLIFANIERSLRSSERDRTAKIRSRRFLSELKNSTADRTKRSTKNIVDGPTRKKMARRKVRCHEANPISWNGSYGRRDQRRSSTVISSFP